MFCVLYVDLNQIKEEIYERQMLTIQYVDPNQIKEEQRTLRLADDGVEPVEVENLESQRSPELVGRRPW